LQLGHAIANDSILTARCLEGVAISAEIVDPYRVAALNAAEPSAPITRT
jgi:hypothetical protein